MGTEGNGLCSNSEFCLYCLDYNSELFGINFNTIDLTIDKDDSAFCINLEKED